MRIWQCAYELSTSIHGKSHPGVLLRVELPNGEIGYSDFHPWPELGDVSLNEAIGTLHAERMNHNLRRALELASIDAQFRAKGRSAFLGMTIPASHYLIDDIESLTIEKLASISEQGYKFIKVKMGKNLDREKKVIHRIKSSLPSEIKIRIDFNGRVSRSEVVSVTSELLDICDGIEDGFLPTEDVTVPLSVDEFIDRNPLHQLPLKGRVLKPEVQGQFERDSACENSSLRIWVTNNLGHPLGHSMALALASQWSRGEVGGLQGLQIYPKNSWTEQIRYHGPVTLAPPGTGFGFDHLLKSLKWRELV